MKPGNNFLDFLIKPLSGFSIRVKLILSVTAILLLLGIISNVFVYQFQTGMMTSELQDKGISITRNLAENSVNPILTDDVIELQHLIENIKIAESDVAYVFILNGNGEIIVHTFEGGFPSALLDVNPVNGTSSTRYIKIEGENIFDIAFPVMEGRIGEVHVGMSQTHIDEIVSRSMLVSAGFIFISMLIGAVMAYGAGTYISRPIVSLKKGAVELGKGNLGYKVNVDSKDEIGDLAVTFNIMAEKLETLIHEKEVAHQKILETSRYLDTIISGSHDGISVLDSYGRFEFGNKSFFEIGDYEEKDLIGLNFITIIPPDLHDFMLERWEEVQNGMGKPYETQILSKDGSLRDLMVSHKDIEVEGAKKYVVVVKDVTDIKKLDEMKSDIISNISHELRTPLTIMRGFAELAMDEKDPVKRNEYLRKSIKAIDRQNQMIQDLLEIAVSERSTIKLNYEIVNLKDIIDISVKNVEPKASFQEITISNTIENDISVNADLQQLAYALTKLLDNAVKFNKRGGKVEIRSKQSGEHIEISVQDTGIGIAENDRNKIFDKFYQADSTTTRNYGGSGVGLTITRHIIEAHRGTIRVESELGTGTTFFITLPVEKAITL
ncbi:MAG: ATP-binding protein [Methanosarcinales archaeon]|nr:ATP-binding protein [Methanosarcinales archaeon]